MKTERFKLLCYILSLIILSSTVLFLLWLIANYYLFFLGFSLDGFEMQGKFINNLSPNMIFEITFGTDSATKNLELLATGISTIGSKLSLLFAMLIAWRFFLNLSKGYSPFNESNVRNIKLAGIAIMIGNASQSLIYATVISILQPKGIWFSFYITPFFFIGFAIYLSSQVVRYGVTLQKFSDDSV